VSSPRTSETPPTAHPAPPEIVLDHPRQHLGARLWRRLHVVAGALLLAVGLIASVPAVPLNLAALGFALGWLTTESTDPDPWPDADVPVRELLLAWAVVTPVALVATRGGLRLLRRNRALILFLRRFGHDAAQAAVTFAVLRTIGASWRVVTLDDAEMAPIGVAAGPRRLFRAGHLTSKHVMAVAHFAGLRTFPVLITAMWGVVALQAAGGALDYLRTGETRWGEWAAALDPYVRILAAVFDGRAPVEAIGPTLPGLFAILAIAAAISFGVLILTMAALLVALPLSAVLMFLSSSADAVREAETTKAVAVTSPSAVRHAAQAIARRSRRVFGPRLVVVRVSSDAWQQTVAELASLASVPLIDVSEPTDNVLWELEQLTARFGDRCVLIAEHGRAVALAAPGAARLSPEEHRLTRLLAGRQVLAYTLDRQGLRRFARALRGMLLARRP
jgi:hypothetical protein